MKTIQHIIIICAFFMAQALAQSNSTIAKLNYTNQLKAKLVILKRNNGHRAPFIQTDEVLAATNAFLN